MYVGSFGWYGYCYSQSQRVAPLGLAGGSGLARRAGFGMRRVPPAAAHQSHRPPQKVNTSRILAVVAASTSTRISGPTAPRAPRLGIRGRKIGRRSHTHHATRRGVHARSPARTAYIHRTYDSSPDRPGSVTGPVASSRRRRARAVPCTYVVCVYRTIYTLHMQPSWPRGRSSAPVSSQLHILYGVRLRAPRGSGLLFFRDFTAYGTSTSV